MKVLAIIVSYNFMRWIDRCLPSLQRQQGIRPDIMVVDNQSTDGTCEYLKKNYPEVRLIENGSNLGFGRANNIGMETAVKEGYDGVLLLNQDAWIDPDCLVQLIEASQKYPQFGILSPLQLAGDGSRLERGFADYVGTDSLNAIPHDKDAVAVSFVNAAIWYMPISTIKTVGQFSPLFQQYGEDRDYSNRTHYRHLAVAYVPSAHGCHDRDWRPMTHAGFRRTEYVYHLSEYANPNYSFGTAFAYAILAAFKKAAVALGRGRTADFGMYAAIALNLLRRTPEVCRARKESKGEPKL